ncbi:oxidoreductase-like domain-containing protein [Alteromonas gilva]|uniref:Oxidoreductase-like domain-containing protein n=1 Tax=Alteromonas gilva TaxID=2987522 RepID=A0ABT5KZ84_9ALTE|nr:oxidoreductase-like domain-containing protein [Alteromonas gilva]MDC8829521.1 oxidoreductase-like domain-containing protein [Alteromonas gilva]
MQKLPPKPREPLMDDCCGDGCCPCIWDIYYQKITQWREVKQALEEQNTNDDSNENGAGKAAE